MEESYWSRYAELARRHWWWRARNRIVLDVLASLSLPEGARILDVGCADGYLFPSLERFGRVYGLEPEEEIVRASAHAHRIHVGGLDAGFRPGMSFELILMLDVLEHLDAPGEALDTVAQLLAPGGRLVLTVPAFRLLWTRHDELNEHRTRYRRGELMGSLADAGFQAREARYAFHALFLAKLLVRAAEATGMVSSGVPGIPPRPVNEVMYGLHRLEERLLGRLGLPFGSTILAVAEKSAEGRKS